ncbi:collagen-like protein [Cyanobacterium sp. uoEpiScrs1]|uniref:collagen-like protein n=1 Tax=Cyanobacterium sp. uoEpiScrs1 TaxID=2976343 RepID=UPI00226AEFA6|nr:collagen-like protein [Cyanobacterium sp. uoEpiScrs1]
MHVTNKFLLFTIFFASSFVVPPVVTPNRCYDVVWSADIKSFGADGQNGQSGQAGRNNKNSDDLTLFADGSPLILDLTGLDGEKGKNGQDGKAANCESQPIDVSYNLQAPSGGNGGNGGNGGDGGNGGSLVIYTTNITNLEQIHINAAGGKGGQAGFGGKGGQACQCSNSYWNLEICTGNPGDSDYRCTTGEFHCQDGIQGSNGMTGLKGRNGVVGKLTLINLDKPLKPDEPAATVTMATLKKKGYLLSKNKWETRKGAIALFSPGSIIDDQYLALTERIERSFLLVWNAPQQFSKFANQKITLGLEDSQRIKIDLPDNLWIEATTQQQNKLTQFIVYNAIRSEDATQLGSAQLSGSKSNLQLTLIDKGQQSDLISTKFKIIYKTTRSDARFRSVSDYITRYDGNIPEELVTLDGNKFTLKIGKLPIKTNELKSGLGVEIKILAIRSFAGYSAKQSLTVKNVLK